MGLFFVYILKSSVCLAAFYLFYRLLLSRETFHRFNRFALLGILLLSCLLPLVEVSVKQETEIHRNVLTLEQLLMMADAMNAAEAGGTAEAATVTWVQVALLLYGAGIVFFALRNACSLVRLLMWLKSGTKEDIGRYLPGRKERATLVVHRRGIAPFSWMRYIVISRKDLEENGREILIHELAHIRNRHSWDLPVADACIFFQWFNPASWLLRQELQNIHEFEADETVIKEGVDAKQYQLLLIKKAVGTRLYSMANSFNHSKLKKRITMMLKEKSSPWARLKYLYVLPVAAVAVAAFARPEVSDKVEEISNVKVNGLAAIVETKVAESVDVPPEFPGGMSASMQHLRADMRYPEGQAADAKNTVPVKFRLDDSQSGDSVNGVAAGGVAAGNGKEPLYVVDGKEVASSVMGALNPDKIESVTLLKDKSATELYGEKGKNGVVLITLKPRNSRNIDQIRTVYVDGVKIDLGNRNIKDVVPAGQIKGISIDKRAGANGEIHITTEKAKDAEKTSVQGAMKVKGRVIDENGSPVVGAIVLVEGTKTGTVTDTGGHFALSVPSKDAVLVVSYIGMATAKMKACPELAVILKSK